MVFFSLLSVLIAYKETSRVRPLRIKEGDNSLQKFAYVQNNPKLNSGSSLLCKKNRFKCSTCVFQKATTELALALRPEKILRCKLFTSLLDI